MTNTTHPIPVAGNADTASPKLLRGVLRENAIFSIVSGSVLAVGASRLDSWLGLNTWLLVALGVALIVYGDVIWFGSSRDHTLARTGEAAIVGDIGWVVAAVVIIAATSVLTRNGEIVLALASIPVAGFALGQYVGLSRL